MSVAVRGGIPACLSIYMYSSGTKRTDLPEYYVRARAIVPHALHIQPALADSAAGVD